MEVFNKLYSQVSSSVSSTVSQLSGVLPGNPVTREFEASTHIASAGPGLLWKIYKGSKRSTKQEASIFVLEKRQLDKYNKTDRELILETLRRGITQLTKIRHPQLLTVQHPLEESRESLAFATEPIFSSLANVLGKTTNMPQPTNLNDFKLHDLEIKYGLLQLGEGLAFLHNDMKLVHGNLSPESVVINKQGVWKIFGLDFCILNSNPPNLPPSYAYSGYNPTFPEVCCPNLEFCAPECVLSSTISTGSDMFSIGVLAYVLNSTGNQPLSAPIKNVQDFRARVQFLKQLNYGKLQCVPEGLRECLKMLLSVTPENRPDAHHFVKVAYFEDVGVKTLNYLDSLLQWDNLQKSKFYKGLPESLPKLPHRVKVHRVLSCLSRDLAQPAMVPFLLPSILGIARDCTKEEFVEHVLPLLKPIMKIMEPIQILLILLQNMELLLKLTPAEDVQQQVLPMLYRGLDSQSTQIHELCLSVLPTFASLLDHSNVKNSLLPRIKHLCLSTSSLSVRVNCLLCIGKLLEHLDKWLVLDEILPFLPQIPSREPAVLMGILGIYKMAMNHKKLGISKELMAGRVLPFLIPLCIENGLSLNQFNALVALVKEMFRLVETEHRTKLEQLNTVRDEQKILTETMPGITATGGGGNVDLGHSFSGLGLDSFVLSPPPAAAKTPPPSLEPIKPVEVKSTTPTSRGGQLTPSGNFNNNFDQSNSTSGSFNNNFNQSNSTPGSFNSNFNYAKTPSTFNSPSSNFGGTSGVGGGGGNLNSWSIGNTAGAAGAFDDLFSPGTARVSQNFGQNQQQIMQPLMGSNSVGSFSNSTSNFRGNFMSFGNGGNGVANANSINNNNNNRGTGQNALSKDEIMDLLS